MDWLLLFLAVGLTFFGGLMIRSTELNQPVNHWLQHWVFGGIGVAVAFGIARISYNHLIRWHWATYGLTSGLLVAVDWAIVPKARSDGLVLAVSMFSLRNLPKWD